MADFQTALDFMLDHEDHQRTYAATVDNNGGTVVAGINSKFFPHTVETIMATPQPYRFEQIAEFYQMEFWNAAKIGLIVHQRLANSVFDSAVNQGPATAIRMLQEAANQVGSSLTVDGHLGILSSAAINGADQDRLLVAFTNIRVARYVATEATVGEHRAWVVRATDGLAGLL